MEVTHCHQVSAVAASALILWYWKSSESSQSSICLGSGTQPLCLLSFFIVSVALSTQMAWQSKCKACWNRVWYLYMYRLYNICIYMYIITKIHMYVYLLFCILRDQCDHNRNLGISRAPLKSQAHQGTSLFTSATTNQRGCSKGSPW